MFLNSGKKLAPGLPPSQMLGQAVEPPTMEAIRQTVRSLADAEALEGLSSENLKFISKDRSVSQAWI